MALSRSQSSRRDWIALAPALAVLVGLLGLPLLNLLHESFRLFEPGRIGANPDAPYTFENYAELLKPAYRIYFLDTFRIGLEASLIALLASYPISYWIAQGRSVAWSRIWIAFLVSLLFLGTLVRIYAVLLALSPAGFGRGLAGMLGLSVSSRAYLEISLVVGLLQFLIPMAALALIGGLQGINPRLVEAAQALGASRMSAFLTVTLPLSTRALLAAFVLCYTFCISAFVVPMILGKGRVLFASNLIYSQFGELGNYPGGAAISIVMLLISVVLLYIMTRLTNRRIESV